MDQNSLISTCSPNLKSTPIKRLGLCHKRKSLLERSIHKKPTKENDSGPSNVNSPYKCIFAHDDATEIKTTVISTSKNTQTQQIMETTVEKDVKNDKVNNGNQKEVKEKTENTCQSNKELENLVEIWRSGCKESLLHLLNLINERNERKMNMKQLVMELGIAQIVKDNLEHDSELDISDEE